MSDSSGSFDFGNAFEPEKRPHDPAPILSPAPVTPATHRLPVPHRDSGSHRSSVPDASQRPRRGQTLAWVALMLVVASALAIGFGLFLALDSIRIPVSDSLGDARSWLLVSVVGLCGAILAFALSVVATVTARPRKVATTALVLAFALPPIAAALGAYFGANALFDELMKEMENIRDGALRALTKSVHEDGLSLDAVLELIELVFSLV